MNFKHSILIGLLFCVNLLFSRNDYVITGKVLEKDSQEPLPGLLVFNQDNKHTLTDFDGTFHLSLSEGEHILYFSFLGYEEKVLFISTTNTNIGTVEMEMSSTSLNEIIVSASAQNFRGDFKGANYRISPEIIKNINPLSTEEILRTIPGINIIGDMGLSNRPNISIRGSWGRRSKKVLLMEDGSPSAPAPYIAPGAYYNPVSDRLKAIEVYKGADMLRYGPNNMYGAINYITALPSQKPELRVKLIGGQRDYMTGLVSYGGTWNNLGALVEGVYKKFDGFTDNSGVEVLNLNTKIFSKLSDTQSLYFKVSGQIEDNQASLSSLTPFTYNHSPTENPFDADQFTMRRYGLDLIHKWSPKANINLTSKIYFSDFERDWWRQTTAKIKVSEAEEYLSTEIFNQRYAYLNGLNYGDSDYVRVGRLQNGREATTDSRWAFTVIGLDEKFQTDWVGLGQTHSLEVGLKLHKERYKDRSLLAEDSRWARSGQLTSDINYDLIATAAYIRNAFHFNQFEVTPILRFEYTNMYKHDLFQTAQNPTINDIDEGRENNQYEILLPGLTLDYKIGNGQFYSSIYRGFIAPSKIFGFLVEKDGVITNPLANEAINIKPELSWNREIGWRGSLLRDRVNGQIIYFNNMISNFFAGGRHEVFTELGRINVSGLEVGIQVDLIKTAGHNLNFYTNATLLQTKILSGQLEDRDLFTQVIHSEATRQELIEKVNSNRQAYTFYTLDNLGESVVLDESLNENNFNDITISKVKFGEGGVTDATVPYSPKANITLGINYKFKQLAFGFSTHRVSSQFTEFNNFNAESADGAIGKLPAYYTMDTYLNYNFTLRNKYKINTFLNVKNLNNRIYKASRLNRATSGIFPGGFRQIIFGLNFNI